MEAIVSAFLIVVALGAAFFVAIVTIASAFAFVADMIDYALGNYVRIAPNEREDA